MKRLILFSVCLIFFSSSHLAFAGLMINEIMYDLSGSDTTNNKSQEWIEIYNPDASAVSVDASIWRIFDGSANKTINDQVNFSIPAGAYVIWAGDKDTFLADHPGFSGVVYDTGITSLNNTGATLKILDQGGNAIETVTYTSTQGAAGDCNSLQKISTSWVGATPTPGMANASTTTSSSTGGLPVATSSSNDNSSTSNTATETKTKTIEKPKIRTQIITKTLVFMGVPVSLEANAFGYSGEKLYSGKYFWNFGDGDSKEAKANETEQLTHTYFYPGEYNVNLEYYMYSYQNVPDASDRITIKVIGADISISRVGDEKDFFVELSNNTDYDADLSGWLLLSASKSFTMARNTILTPQQKMIISSKTTNFSIEDKNTLKLMTPQRGVAFDYGDSLVVPVSFVAAPESPPLVPLLHKEGRISPSLPKGSALSLSKGEAVLSAPDGNIPIKNLPAPLSPGGPASIISNDAIPKSSSNSFIPAIISFVFIGVSAGAVYFIRQKKIISNPGDDFAILDK